MMTFSLIRKFKLFLACNVLLFSSFSVSAEPIMKSFDVKLDVGGQLKYKKMLALWESEGDQSYEGNEVALKLSFGFGNPNEYINKSSTLIEAGVIDFFESGVIRFKKCDAQSDKNLTSCINGVEIGDDYNHFINVLNSGYDWGSAVKDSNNDEVLTKNFTEKNRKNIVTHCWDYQNSNKARGWKKVSQEPYLLLPYCKEQNIFTKKRITALAYLDMDQLETLKNYFTKELPSEIWSKLKLDKQLPYLSNGGERISKEFEIFRYQKYPKGTSVWQKDYLIVSIEEKMHYSLKPHLNLMFTKTHLWDKDIETKYLGLRSIPFKWCSEKQIKKGSKKCATGGTRINKDYDALRNMLIRSIKISETALQEDLETRKPLDNVLKGKCGKWQPVWWRKWNPFLMVTYKNYVENIWRDGFTTPGGNYVPGEYYNDCIPETVYIPLSTQKELLSYLTDDLPGRIGGQIKQNRENTALENEKKKDRALKLLDGI
jgi:hypothetical protein